MRIFNKYDVFIFDCDGVILDSNNLKLIAMQDTLLTQFSNRQEVCYCIDYFRNNFGKSRFHHVDHFLRNILNVKEDRFEEMRISILNSFSLKCRSLYAEAKLTPGILDFLGKCEGKRYVASGSEQTELKEVFYQRRLDCYFEGIFGSPTSKTEIIKRILDEEKSNNAVLFGDAEADLLSARSNDIDFIFYSPFSNVKEQMIEQCNIHRYLIIDDFSTLGFHNER